MRKITADFEASHDRDLGDAKVRLHHNESQSTSWDLTWDELEQLVHVAQQLLEKRDTIRSTQVSETVKREIERDELDWHEACGHYHQDHDGGCPDTPCGDYRCCIN